MIVLFGMPVFGAYGVVYKASWGYYGAVLLGFVPLLVIAAAVGIICTMGLVRLFPARRTKEILVLLSILFLVCLYLLFRFLQPERLFEEAELELDDARDALVERVIGSGDLAQDDQQLLEPILEDRDEDIVLVLEVKIDGAVRDSSGLGDLADAGRVEAVLGEDLDRRLENPVPLVGRVLLLGC